MLTPVNPQLSCPGTTGAALLENNEATAKLTTANGGTSCGIMWTLISLPPQMAERLRRAQPDSVANHVTARSISD